MQQTPLGLPHPLLLLYNRSKAHPQGSTTAMTRVAISSTLDVSNSQPLTK